jgi:circadian clock protein KaiC
MTNETINLLKTGVPGLDTLLSGGLPEFSFNLIGGAPGSGKTTFCQQIMFALASPERRAIFFTAIGEPPLKMLRYQQQFEFFDTDKIEESIRFVNLGAEVMEGSFEKILARIVKEVRDFSPSLVFVDSFRSIISKNFDNDVTESSIQNFGQYLAMQMTNWQATTFLIGEYIHSETHSNPIFTIADSIFWFTQNIDRNAMVRKVGILKIRGRPQTTGMHTFRITSAGIEIFPRMLLNFSEGREKGPSENKLSTGSAGLDSMLGGGLPEKYSLLVVGPSGSGKTVMGAEFLRAGAKKGEPGLLISVGGSSVAIIHEKLDEHLASGLVHVMDLFSIDLSIDETLHDTLALIERYNIKRVFFDSLSGFELALAPEFRDSFRSSLYRITSALTSKGVTVIMSTELEDRFTELSFSSFGNAFLMDGIVLMRYVELGGELGRILSVVKLRGINHNKQIKLFEITDSGIEIRGELHGYKGLLIGQAANSDR